MRKILAFIILSLSVFSVVQSQSVDDIKNAPNEYLWGEGHGLTLKKADQEALSMLISQISTQVESSFTLLQDETLASKGKDEYKQTVQSVVKTYSSATLKNTERIILGNEPDAVIFRYIKRRQVDKIFIERRDKIIGFVRSAEKSLSNHQIADALRYYYWALSLLKSHPNGASINYIGEDGNSNLLISYLPHQINKIFSDLDIYIQSSEIMENSSLFTLEILYQGFPVENFDYSYWDGADWSNLIGAKNGIGWVELFGMSKDTKKLRLKAEYIFEGEARIDRELEDVLKKIDPIPFPHSYFSVLPKKVTVVAEKKPEKIEETELLDDTLAIKQIVNTAIYDSVMKQLINNIGEKQYLASEKLFTPEAYMVYQKLIQYGNAKVLSSPELNYVEFEDRIICRALAMKFSFEANNKEFVEYVVFYFNKDKKIDGLSFSLSDIALKDILNKQVWSERDRMTLVSFLEHYKTAYALKRIDYIEQIFSDDALIITGSIVKVKANDMNNFSSNKIVRYNKQTKQEYIKNLRHMFLNKEYVNIKFEDSKIRKAGKGGDIYGVQIKQNFYSSNYGDVGYLFLMVDLNNPDEPIIHVRTWQPEVKNDTSMYGLSDFN